MMRLHGRTAVVTGAAGGIGRAIAVSLGRRGCHLALADVDENGLAGTARQVGAAVRVTTHMLDVSDRAGVAAFPDAVLAAHPGVDVLVNNAGVALGGTFAMVSEADFDWLIEINFHGLVRMIRAFLPVLHASDEARIVNLSSLFGLIAPPGQTAYAASKFAVRGFSDALRHELEGSGVGVTVVHPGGVATRIATSARLPSGVDPGIARRERDAMNRLLKMPPERAGEIIVAAVERRRARVLVGNDAKLAALVERLLPSSYWSVFKRLKTS